MESRTTYIYKKTIYSFAITRLTSLGTNPNSVSVNCPKIGCKTNLFRTQQLYRHIETAHPEDKLHIRNYSSSFSSTSTAAEAEPALSIDNVVFTDAVEMSSDEEMDIENDYYEEVPIANIHSESYVNDYLNDEYLKVCNYFIILYLTRSFSRALWPSSSSTSTLKEWHLH